MNAITFVGLQDTRTNTTLGRIERVVCETLYLTTDELRSKKRDRHLVEARNIFFCISKKLNTDITLKKLGSYLNKNHATVMHSIKNCKSWIDTDAFFEEKFDKCLTKVRGETYNDTIVISKWEKERLLNNK